MIDKKNLKIFGALLALFGIMSVLLISVVYAGGGGGGGSSLPATNRGGFKYIVSKDQAGSFPYSLMGFDSNGVSKTYGSGKIYVGGSSCKALYNECDHDLLIPQKNTNEYNSFVSHLPSCVEKVNTASCNCGVNCNTGGGGSTYVSTSSSQNAIQAFADSVTPSGAYCSTCGPHNSGNVVYPSGGACFTANQNVLTLNGEVPISQIKAGDTVVSYDINTGKFVNSKVKYLIVHDGKDESTVGVEHEFKSNYSEYPLILLTVKDSRGVTQTEVTSNHPYFDPSTGRYKFLYNFNEGDKVQTVNGIGTIISEKTLVDGSSSQSQQSTVVYNLELYGDYHNYIVNGVVVHNYKTA